MIVPLGTKVKNWQEKDNMKLKISNSIIGVNLLF